MLTARDELELRRLHDDLLERHPIGSYASLGWSDPAKQRSRFSVLSDIGDLCGHSVLDLGCGYGDFKAYLDELYSQITYVGIDLIPTYIEYANQHFSHDANATFINGDFSKIDLPRSDYIFASGSFSLNFSNYRNYLIFMIRRMYAACNYGIGLNLPGTHINKAVRFGPYHIIGNDTNDLRSYCETLSNNVVIRSNYLPDDDFTVYMYKK